MKKETSGGCGGIGCWVIIIVIVVIGKGLYTEHDKDIEALENLEKTCITVSAEKVDPANEGKLIYTSAPVDTEERLTDKEFNLKIHAIRLIRHVEMFQWEEYFAEDSNNEEKPKYRQIWGDRTIDSSKFESSQEHQNPPFKITVLEQQAESVTFGDFTLSRNLVSDAPVTDYTFSSSYVNPQEKNRIFLKGKEPPVPNIGDHRVWFSVTWSGSRVSVLGCQKQKTIGTYPGLEPASCVMTEQNKDSMWRSVIHRKRIGHLAEWATYWIVVAICIPVVIILCAVLNW